MLDHQGMQEVISFNVGGQEFCFGINSVREIRGWTPATKLPHSPAHLRGVINLRGSVMPVVDLSARLGFGLTEATERHVIIVAEIRGQQVGLLVDAVCETLNISPDQIQSTPQIDELGPSTLVRGFVPLESRMISILAIDDIVEDRVLN